MMYLLPLFLALLPFSTAAGPSCPKAEEIWSEVSRGPSEVEAILQAQLKAGSTEEFLKQYENGLRVARFLSFEAPQRLKAAIDECPGVTPETFFKQHEPLSEPSEPPESVFKSIQQKITAYSKDPKFLSKYTLLQRQYGFQ